jgi:hypothetical protein
MVTRVGISVTVVAVAFCAACGSSSKVFFVEPKDGATVKPDVHVVFGSKDITIAAVPSGDVTEARPGTVHYHVAPDTECLPVGQPIPKADPWVHFGKGTDNADLQLTPGQHKLTVQAGDDMHRTIENACQTITVTVAP